jgi:anhydro-N-acetylmuramic acid kinase
MIVAGVMSGTSVDGINVAVVRVTAGKTSGLRLRVPQSVGQECPTHTGASGSRLEFLGHAEFAYPAAVRRMVLAAMNSSHAKVADLARLNFLLGELYADAVLGAQKKLRIKAELVGCHGQTLYHQGTPASFLGKKLAATWQTGEAAVIAARVGIPVVADFRPADMAAGGMSAPLVPYLDYILFRDAKVGRIAQNIGGIANLTAIPAGASLDQIVAFDTGPGNMVMDALTEKLFGKPFDRDGKIAASGRVLEPVVARFLRGKFFRQKPPRTAGREEYGREFAEEFLRACGNLRDGKRAKHGAATALLSRDTPVRGGQVRASFDKLRTSSAPTRAVPGRAARGMDNRDIVATATAFTARSIRDAIERFVLPGGDYSELIVSGGGANNPTLMAGLAHEMRDLQLRLRSSDEFGIPSEAKEAVAFAALAFETWNQRPSNVPAATGAKRAAVLGKVSYP